MTLNSGLRLLYSPRNANTTHSSAIHTFSVELFGQVNARAHVTHFVELSGQVNARAHVTHTHATELTR